MSQAANRAVVVTGASGGIGLATATLLAQQNFHVYATTRDGQAPAAINPAVAANVTWMQLSLSDHDGMHHMVERIGQLQGKDGLFALINNAASATTAPLELCTASQLCKMLETNVVAVHELSRLCLPMLARAQGRIINIASTSALAPSPLNGAYAVSKAALAMLSNCMRLEYGAKRISIATLYPGVVATEFWSKIARQETDQLANPHFAAYWPLLKSRTHMLKRFAKEAPSQPCDVAEVILAALTAPTMSHSFVIGRDAKIRMLLAKLLPRYFWERRAARQLAHNFSQLPE